MEINTNQVETTKNINFKDVLNDSWNLFVRVLGMGALAVAIYGFASGILSYTLEIVTGFSAISNDFLADIQNQQDPNRLFSLLQGFYMENLGLIFLSRYITEIVMLLAFPLAGGFMLVCREVDKSGTANFSTLFEGFKPEYWGRLMVVALLYFLISNIAFAFFIIPGIYVWVAAVLACPFVMFTNLSGLDAVKASFRLVNKNWLDVFKILFIASLFGLAGYLLCFVGRIFTYPFVLTSVYMLYKYMVGFEDDKISEIGQ